MEQSGSTFPHRLGSITAGGRAAVLAGCRPKGAVAGGLETPPADAGAYGPRADPLGGGAQKSPAALPPSRPYRKPTQVGGSNRPRRVSEPPLRNSAN